MESHIQIFDTTLRDGEQTPGVNFSFDERLKIAKQLETWVWIYLKQVFPLQVLVALSLFKLYQIL